jgi:hypothetical protein
MMHQSIEMGRAFIIREYQQNRCLFSCFGKDDNSYYFTLPEHKLGGVSISNQFSDFSKSLMNL